MSRPLLILRPLEGALQTERRAQELGLQTVVDPLFVIEPISWSAPPARDFDALLLTSANAVNQGGPMLDRYRSLPVLAVGKATAEAAAGAGFQIAEIGVSGAQSLLSMLPSEGYRRILWLAGEQHSQLDVGERRLQIVPVYRSKAIPLGGKARTCLERQSVVLLHSARAARQLATEMNRLDLKPDRLHAVAFSAKVAEAAGEGWSSLHVADRPDDDTLLSLASGLCRNE